MAEIILNRDVRRRDGYLVDIEGIVKDFGITPKLRENLRKCVKGRWPIDPRFIYIEKSHAPHLALYRSHLAGDFCHILLGYDLLTCEEIPKKLPRRNLTRDEYLAINRDAQYLACAILLPKDLFIQKWKECVENAPESEKINREKLVLYCTGILISTFCSNENRITYRAIHLKLMTGEELLEFFL